jgi:rubrerythrin
MTITQIKENELWLLSFYRYSEIQGALFFARLAQTIPSGSIQCDITRHFADESQHARYWTDCITQLGETPLKLGSAYQDKYFKEAGVPKSLMEVLAITQVFEVRAIREYGLHLKVPDLNPLIRETLNKIMKDETWHLSWVDEALKGMEQEYTHEKIATTIRNYRQIDQRVFEETIKEHQDRIQSIVPFESKGGM